MELNENILRSGKRFIVGKWRVDYVVNAFSNDLAHIPASEFKSEDGSDFTALTFDFFEDQRVVMTDTSKGKTVEGTWEQTDMFEYKYELKDFLQIPEGDFRKAAETLTVSGGTHLVFGIGFLAIAMKKESDGVITKPADIGDMQGDEDACEIVGKYSVAKSMAFIGGNIGLFTYEEVKADLDKKAADGEDADPEMLSAFSMKVEFTPDHKVLQWMKLPDGVPEEAINAALESGEIAAASDGYFCARAQEWKCVDGKYYYNTGEHRESFGEELSSWDELVEKDGLIKFGSGTMMIKKD